MKYYIGVDVGGTSVKLGIVDENGNVSGRREVPYRNLLDKMSVMDVIRNAVHDLMNDAEMFPEACSGIGVSAAGCINSVTGSVAGNGGNVPGWSHTEVVSELREEFGIPASLANDANCAVLGEYWAGAAKGYTDVLGVTLGTGIGGGVITGGRLLEGARGYGGEIGHFPIHAGGTHCICGIDGCYERYASTSALTLAASELNPEWESGRVLFKDAAEGNEDALAVIEKWIEEAAWGIAGLVHIFNPEIILIGGGVSLQQELLIEPLRERVLSLIMPDFAEGLEFRSAELGNDAGMAGAVYYLISRENMEDRL